MTSKDSGWKIYWTFSYLLPIKEDIQIYHELVSSNLISESPLLHADKVGIRNNVYWKYRIESNLWLEMCPGDHITLRVRDIN